MPVCSIISDCPFVKPLVGTDAASATIAEGDMLSVQSRNSDERKVRRREGKDGATDRKGVRLSGAGTFKYHSTPNSACSVANKTERTLPNSIEKTNWPTRPYQRHCADLCIKVARNELSD